MAENDKTASYIADALNSFITIAEDSSADIKRQAQEVQRSAALVLEATSKLQQRVDGVDNTIERAINRNLSESVTKAAQAITKALDSANVTAGRAAKQLNEAAEEVANKVLWAGALGGGVGAIAGAAVVLFVLKL